MNVYGWAAWNGKKATVTLRNPDVKERTLSTTLREVLDIPAYIKTTVTLSSAFADQLFGTDKGLRGIDIDTPVDIGKELTFRLPASSVFVMDGVDNGNFDFPTTAIPQATATAAAADAAAAVYDLQGRRIAAPQKGTVSIVGSRKVIK